MNEGHFIECLCGRTAREKGTGARGYLPQTSWLRLAEMGTGNMEGRVIEDARGGCFKGVEMDGARAKS